MIEEEKLYTVDLRVYCPGEPDRRICITKAKVNLEFLQQTARGQDLWLAPPVLLGYVFTVSIQTTEPYTIEFPED